MTACGLIAIESRGIKILKTCTGWKEKFVRGYRS